MGEASFGVCERCRGILTLFDTGPSEEGVVRWLGRDIHVHRGCAFEHEEFIPIKEWIDRKVAERG